MLEFFAFLNSLFPLSAEALAAMLKSVIEKKYRKGQHLLRKGDTCQHMAFIKKGLLKVYFDRGDKEVALWYNREMDAVLSVYSFFSKIPSKLSIKCMEECELVLLPYTEIENLYERYPEYNKHARLILQHYYSLSETHVMLMYLTPRERFEEIKKIHPWMVDGSRLNDTMLADYLGVNRTTLSRWRNGK
ncbi:MAG: Crp/Fnr family transcriptional regulator [Bacteroidota bacterium]